MTDKYSMRVFGYMRVSGDGQIDGDGFFRQKEAIENFCASNGLVLSGFVREEGVSGTVEDRPGLAELIADQPDVIIVERMDRLARDLMVQEFLIQEMVKEGIILYSADQGGLINIADSTADPARVFIRQVLGAVAQFDKSATVLKLAKARARTRKEKGKCEGRKRYATHPDRPWEKRIAQTVLAGRAMGLNYRLIKRAVLAEHGRGICNSSISSVLTTFGQNRKEEICSTNP